MRDSKPRPAETDGNVYIGSSDRKLYALATGP